MKSKKPRKPRDTREFGVTIRNIWPIGLRQPDGSEWVIGLKKAQRLNQWLTRAIAYLEAQKKVRK